ncbi:uncharacterized protein BDR25DRAFT_274596 [Lindgomyces ingoldianus]|uniref:Uncharacterized protein n=1 Tax=Lindgomyces ingoldianus TaxID=673940 RepID=A0ACB6REH9_9PLEO|nr:uncharacterized protein BDR25DRAFT_274596 [Lindgomyces ingoldianus]KAF2477450.1 hypothetical protein BDR25DRAFT_274596 [Lindgomyces ingoldianus]
MGTLTADCPRLDSHCPHKLATSCRLTSISNCCACADERPHSRTYSVYIDGVGLVQRGTRWQGYCWFCKEFWNNRLAATYPPLHSSQTQIPYIPDQTEFLERWFEFHQGYRIVKRAGGIEDRIAVVGEPLKDVSPGFLPRTLHQLRSRRVNDHRRAENRFRRAPLESEVVSEEPPHQGLEDALDSLLEDVSDHEPDGREVRRDVQERERNSNMPRRDSTGLSRPLSRTEIHLHRARDRLIRVFGTREQIEQDDYQSPISTMYNRAYDRYRQAEDRRASGDTIAPSSTASLSPQEREDLEQQVLWSILRDSRETLAEGDAPVGNLTPHPRQLSRTLSDATILSEFATPRGASDLSLPSTNASPSSSMTTSSMPSSSTSSSRSDLQPALDHLTAEINRLRQASETVASIRRAIDARDRERERDRPALTLDNQPNRPPPLTDEEMTKNLACQICYSQLANIAVLPCGHMIMCQYCADVVIPVKHSHLPVEKSKCPMCRKEVKQRHKIHVGC